MYQGYKTFEDIKAWQLAREFRKKIYSVTNKFPSVEIYSLVSQLRRAAISVTSNIAEGYGRYSYQDNIHFCRMSRGSINEVLDQLCIALNENYINQQEFDGLYKEGREVEHAINGYIKFLDSFSRK
ncbi:MAG: four helix bundle protein [Patescibacteria group bacterium]|nr:four helix bundle protein [Patescibacteria group bacterium]MDD4610984.1 four helix bundle protein [Patescibacteria group bacterium]